MTKSPATMSGDEHCSVYVLREYALGRKDNPGTTNAHRQLVERLIDDGMAMPAELLDGHYAIVDAATEDDTRTAAWGKAFLDAVRIGWVVPTRTGGTVTYALVTSDRKVTLAMHALVHLANARDKGLTMNEMNALLLKENAKTTETGGVLSKLHSAGLLVRTEEKR